MNSYRKILRMLLGLLSCFTIPMGWGHFAQAQHGVIPIPPQRNILKMKKLELKPMQPARVRNCGCADSYVRVSYKEIETKIRPESGGFFNAEDLDHCQFLPFNCRDVRYGCLLSTDEFAKWSCPENWGINSSEPDSYTCGMGVSEPNLAEQLISIKTKRLA